jgi:hypothetical protein
MIGKNNKGKKVLFLIEWKYTEYYQPENKYIQKRAEVYDKLIKDINSPFIDINKIKLKPGNDERTKIEAFYYEPFYQMMRQTLLAWKLIENKDHGCGDYYHIHIIPYENEELLNKVTSPYLEGNNIKQNLKSTLNDPNKYISVSPKDFLNPCSKIIDSQSFLSYLKKRYW